MRQLLTKEEEMLLNLIEWITELADRHIPARPAMRNSMAITLLQSREPPSVREPGQTWPAGFIARCDEVPNLFWPPT
jgi:hypothetical protein